MLLMYFLSLAAAVDSTTRRTTLRHSELLTSAIQNSNLGSDFTVPTSTSTSASSSSYSVSSITIPSDFTTENDLDRSMYRVLFWRPTDLYYYDLPITLNEQEVYVRMDLVQNDVWVMDASSLVPCSAYDAFWLSVESQYPSESLDYSLVVNVYSTEAEATATMCADDDAMFTTDADYADTMARGTANVLVNEMQIRVPYVNSIQANGTVITGNLTVVGANAISAQLDGSTFVNVYDANVFVGGFGIGGNSLSNTGFMASLVSNDIIRDNGYSLFFGSYNNENDGAFAQLIPGLVNKKHFIGDFYSFPLLKHVGNRFENTGGEDFSTENTILNNMILPAVAMTGLLIHNERNGNSLDLMTASAIAVMFDSRTAFNFFPLEIIVNIAIQTNAFYNSEINRWIVDCDAISSTDATFVLLFGDLSIRVPISSLLLNATYGDQTLHFSDGSPACFLNCLPTSDAYSVVGVGILKYLFLAFDHAGRNIGIALANSKLTINKDDYNIADAANVTDNYPSVYSEFESRATSIKRIRSGTIPFATTVNSSSPDLTLTVGNNGDTADTLTVPARFSGVYISDGEVFITQSMGQRSAASATAATEALSSRMSGEAYPIASQAFIGFGSTHGLLGWLVWFCWHILA